MSAIHRLSGASSIAEIMEIMTKAVRSLLHADGATFVLRDGDRCFYAEEDAISPLWKGQSFPLSACISGWCMLRGETVAVPDIFKDSRIPVDAYRPTFVSSVAMAPVGHGEAIAAIGAYWSVVREISEDEILMLRTLADAAELAVAYVQLQRTGGAAGGRQPAAERITRAEAVAPGADASTPLRGWWARIRRQGLRQHGVEAYGFAIASALAATLLRLAIGELGVEGVLPFVTYFPAVLLTIVAAGPRTAALTTLIGGGFGLWAFMSPEFGRFLSPAEVINSLLYLAACGLIILIVERYRIAMGRLAAEEARHLTLAREQRHRLENAVQVVETIVRRSLAADPVEARSINERIRAGLANLELQTRQAGEPAPIGAVLREKLQPFDVARFELDGTEELMLSPKAKSLIALAVHELATNALKHGALSTMEGQVRIAWRAAEGRLVLRWGEAGGPEVRAPASHGYGVTLLQRLVKAERGALQMDFAAAGLQVEISLPVAARTPRRGLRLAPIFQRRPPRVAA